MGICVKLCLGLLSSDLGKWTGEQLRRLGSLVKGLDAADIRRISKEAFEEAVGAWGERMDIDVDTLKELAAKAVEVSGHPAELGLEMALGRRPTIS